MLTCAIIGCGRISPNHILAYQSNPNIGRLIACDIKAENARQCAQQYGMDTWTTDTESVFEDSSVDLVSILTDHKAHYPLTRQALLSGKHVVVEKPFTLDVSHARELVTLADQQNRKLICISQHRFDPFINRLRDLYHSGAMGRILMVNARLLCGRDTEYYTASYWHGRAALDGGSALINQGYHIFDILCSFLGLPTKVNAFADRRLHQGIIETEDTLTAQFQFNDGVLGSLNITSGYIAEDWDPTIEMIGTQGRIQFDLRFPHGSPVIDIDDVDPSDYMPGQNEHRPTGKHDYYGDLHQLQLHDFVNSILTGEEPAFDPRESVNTLTGIMKIYQSARANGFQWDNIYP
ncbi:MAG: Gfo/Idh/MocA family oxidoreductase [Anaerolineae bacterium]|nr:Gfo/Idh/MocA family oxidoreductase [Anaerolineae bacterium]